MRKKIYRRLIGIAAFSILFTLLVTTAIFCSRLKTQVFSDLRVMAELLAGASELGAVPADIRVTVIRPDGTVVYDSFVDAEKLENHLERPEIMDALILGMGRKVRRSDTLSESVFYYALRREDGQILRVGKTSGDVLWMLISALPVAGVMILVLVVVCVLTSRRQTAALVAPIERLAVQMEHIDESGLYEELVPIARRLRFQYEEVLSATNMRQEFTANVTHELKTPLAAILGYAELMESGVAREADIRHFSREIEKSASRLLALINDMIKLARLDAGGGEETPELVDLAKIAADTVDMLSASAERIHVSVSFEGKASPVRIGTEWAQELTYNLIENAIRYNRPNGAVKVSVTESGNTVSLVVADTGIGIPREHQERIFERFYRVDKSRLGEFGGTGLGLAIVKHICDLTGGRLFLESREHQGTTIAITWDCEVSPSPSYNK